VASLAAFVALPVITFLTQRSRPDFPYLLALTVGLMALVWIRHRDNLDRLRSGKERPLEIRK
jgi:glycerol-3-phosphate acyltransferase PlsY